MTKHIAIEEVYKYLFGMDNAIRFGVQEERKMKVIYVAGPYTAVRKCELEDNIRHATRAAKELWQEGWAVICPHTNSAHFEDTPRTVYNTWLNGYIEILSRCDAIYMLKGWEESSGASFEHATAIARGMEILYE
ncbi:hypothetical protein LCGC14_1388850 [marine sediment metagenome]|uniref:DUF1937 domain-containing protein n=1 Tax=marine sediment metagenome TaxID=412755 RepID=A0A0F9MG32_9ZZZZ